MLSTSERTAELRDAREATMFVDSSIFIDGLVILKTTRVRDVLAFPLLKPE